MAQSRSILTRIWRHFLPKRDKHVEGFGPIIAPMEDFSDLESVVVQRAYVFTCYACSHRQFGEMETAELTDEDRQEIREMLQIDPEDDRQGVEMCQLPTVVTCSACKTRFRVDHENSV